MLILLVNSSSVWNVDMILELEQPSWTSVLKMEVIHLEDVGKTEKGLGYLRNIWSF